MSEELDPKALRKVAEAATTGPWEVKPYTHGPLGYERVRVTSPSDEYAWNLAEEVLPANATHIATFDPPTVLRLLDLVESEAEYAELNPKLAAILRDTVNALKGEPEPLVSHSWHDLAEVATELITRLEQAEQQVARVRELANEANQQEIHMKWIHPEDILRALDGDGRG